MKARQVLKIIKEKWEEQGKGDYIVLSNYYNLTLIPVKSLIFLERMGFIKCLWESNWHRDYWDVGWNRVKIEILDKEALEQE